MLAPMESRVLRALLRIRCSFPEKLGQETQEWPLPIYTSRRLCDYRAKLVRSAGFGSAVHQRPRGGEQLPGLQPGLQAGEDHRPAAVELAVRSLAQLVMGDGQPARVADRLDLPGD